MDSLRRCSSEVPQVWLHNAASCIVANCTIVVEITVAEVHISWFPCDNVVRPGFRQDHRLRNPKLAGFWDLHPLKQTTNTQWTPVKEMLNYAAESLTCLCFYCLKNIWTKNISTRYHGFGTAQPPFESDWLQSLLKQIFSKLSTFIRPEIHCYCI